jgi:hypothetical protein
MFKLNIIPAEFSSNLTPEHLQKYGNGEVFIETGTYLGDTVKLALKQPQFKRIHSIELNNKLFSDAVEMFKGEPRVTIWLGDSIDTFPEIFKDMTEVATFWLDAHASGPYGGGHTGGSPLLDELRRIQMHPINYHTIFIDDRRLFGSQEWSGIAEEDAIALLKEINPNYNIYYLNGYQPEDIICASVR